MDILVGSRRTADPTNLTTWVTATLVGVAVAVAVLTDSWLYLVFGVAGAVFAAIALAHPRAALLLWLLLAPAANTYANLSLPAGLPDLTFGRVSITLVIVALLLRTMLKGRGLVAWGTIEKAMLALLGIMMLDLFVRGGDLTSDALEEFDLYVTPLLLFLAARNLLVQRDDLKKLAWILTIVGFYLALHGALQYAEFSSPGGATTDDITLREGGERVHESHLEEGRSVGPFGNAVEYGSVAAIALMAALFLTSVERAAGSRLIAAATLLPIAVAVILSATRSAWLGAYLGIVALACLQRRRRAAILGAIGTVTLAGLIAIMAMPESFALKERAFSLEPVYGRLVMYRVAATLALKQPLFGYGRGTPSRVAARREIYALGGRAADWAPGQFHNTFLGLLVEWGVLGLTAYVAVLVLPIVAAFELRRRVADEHSVEHHFAGFFVMTAVVFVVQAVLVDSPAFLYLNGVYFVLAGVIYARLDAIPCAPRRQTSRRPA